MRYIDTSSLDIPNNWIDLARINQHNPRWSYLRSKFEDLIGKKCWFNESINDGTSNPIDHFRPKAPRVKILNKRYAVLDDALWLQLSTTANQSGYPFLEYEYINYRYASGFANSQHKRESLDSITRGKSNFFPLKIGTTAAINIESLDSEMYALLDPCNINDPELLNFNEFGGIDPADSLLPNSWEYCRVKVSIEVYNLMYYVISTKRQELWAQSERNIELLNILFNKSEKSAEEQICFDHLFKQFIKSLQKKSEYSAVVIDCVKHYRKRKDRIEYRWLHEFIPCPLLFK